MIIYLALTLIVYWLAKRFYKKTGRMIFSPLIVCPLILISILLVFNIPYEQYSQGGQWLTMMLQPATVALAVPLYKYREMVKKYFVEIIVSVVGGAVVALVTSIAIANLVGVNSELVATLAPRSITVPFAMSVSEFLGGNPAITAVIVIFTGITGTILTSLSLRYLPDTSPITQGMLYGVTAHGTGTAKAFEIGQIEGVVASLAMVFMGIITTVIAMPLFTIMIR